MITRRNLLGTLPVAAAAVAVKSPFGTSEALAATEVEQPDRPWAELDWDDPFPADMLDKMPTMERLHNPGLVSLGIAVRFGMKTKPELMEIVRKAMDGEDGGKWLTSVMDTLKEAEDDFRMFAGVMETGYARMFVAIATVCEEDEQEISS